MKGYPQDFKQKVIDEVKVKGLAVNTVAQNHRIAPKTIYNWLEELSPEAELKALRKVNRELRKDVQAYERLVDLMSEKLKKKT